MHDPLLRGWRILVVEDQYLIADGMRRELAREGATVVGPAPSVAAALALVDAQALDAAILDLNLADDERVFPVAEALQARGIPFVFASGCAASDVPPQWRHVLRVEKPVEIASFAREGKLPRKTIYPVNESAAPRGPGDESP